MNIIKYLLYASLFYKNGSDVAKMCLEDRQGNLWREKTLETGE